MTNEERFPSSVSVSLLLTHGRSGRLILTRHGIKTGEGKESWGLIAGGVERGEDPWRAAMREAKEEAGFSGEHIIFVRGRNNLEPHVALVLGEDKNHLGLVFDTTYSGPRVSMDGWDVADDRSVDRVGLFSWQRVLKLLDDQTQIYRPEFNYPQMVRWILKDCRDESRAGGIERWLLDREGSIPGLTRRRMAETGDVRKFSDRWDYIPLYDSWMGMPGIRGVPSRTNFARERFGRTD